MNFWKWTTTMTAFTLLYGVSLSSREAKELSSVAVSQKLELTQKLTGNEGLKLDSSSSVTRSTRFLTTSIVASARHWVHIVVLAMIQQTICCSGSCWVVYMLAYLIKMIWLNFNPSFDNSFMVGLHKSILLWKEYTPMEAHLKTSTVTDNG